LVTGFAAGRKKFPVSKSRRNPFSTRRAAPRRKFKKCELSPARLNLRRRADVILVLEVGRLTQTGTHPELVVRPGPHPDTAELQMSDLDEESTKAKCSRARSFKRGWRG
jgi:hypothetical protein